MAGKDLTGQRFGKLTVMGKTEQRKSGYVVWLCRCDCGNEVLADTKRLMRGSLRDCGCGEKKDARRGRLAEDLTGQQFGELTAVSRAENRNGRTAWLCRCSCGRMKTVTAHDLKAGKCKSCGAAGHGRGRKKVDLRGCRFGKLTAVCPTERRDRKGSVYWHCVCDCGNETELTESALKYGNYQSCGCVKKEKQKNIAKQLHMVDGTCLEMLEKRKYREDNTSGFRGVYKMKERKYRVNIGFKRKRFYLGTYSSFDEAVEARMEAEKMIHEGFLDAYRKWEERAEKDPKWASENPLVYEVEKKNGSLHIRNSMSFCTEK